MKLPIGLRVRIRLGSPFSDLFSNRQGIVVEHRFANYMAPYETEFRFYNIVQLEGEGTRLTYASSDLHVVDCDENKALLVEHALGGDE